jgi:hypothetical protein
MEGALRKEKLPLAVLTGVPAAARDGPLSRANATIRWDTATGMATRAAIVGRRATIIAIDRALALVEDMLMGEPRTSPGSLLRFIEAVERVARAPAPDAVRGAGDPFALHEALLDWQALSLQGPHCDSRVEATG